ATQFYMSNVRIITNLCMGNLFDRYPNVRISSAESGIGWVPFVLEAMEFQLDEMVTDPAEVTLQKRRPTEYFRDHFYGSFWFEKVGAMQPGERLTATSCNCVGRASPCCSATRGRHRPSRLSPLWSTPCPIGLRLTCSRPRSGRVSPSRTSLSPTWRH